MSVRESFAKAQFQNTKQLQLARAVDTGRDCFRQAHNADCCRQASTQSANVGPVRSVPLEIKLIIARSKQAKLLEFLPLLQESQDIVQISGGPQDLQFWFRGTKIVWDFLFLWCGVGYAWTSLVLQILTPQPNFMAIVPDDMLAVQELHMAHEGMDSDSICPTCQARGIQPIVTSSTSQPCGNPRRMVRFFCHNYCSVHSKVELTPMPPCPVPLDVWNSLWRIDPKSSRLLARPVDSATFNAPLSRLYNDKSSGSEGQPREYCKYGPSVLCKRYPAAINAHRGYTQQLERTGR